MVYREVISIMGKSITFFLFATMAFDLKLEECLGSEGKGVLVEERVGSVAGALRKPALRKPSR